MTRRKPYESRNDLEKIQSQWTKLTGLHDRNESSAAIVRAATAAELAANFAIRNEFQSRSQFETEFVDSLLIWANGLSGKIQRLLLPLSKGREQHSTIKKLEKVSKEINDMRNGIVHRGKFCNPDEAEAIIAKSKAFVEALVQIYEPGFLLTEKFC